MSSQVIHKILGLSCAFVLNNTVVQAIAEIAMGFKIMVDVLIEIQVFI